MLNDFTGGTSLLGMAVDYMYLYLKRCYYRGRYLDMVRDARYELSLSAPDRRLKLDGVTYRD